MAGTGSNGRTSVLRIALLAAGISTIAVGLSACQSDPDIDITAYAASIDPADQLYNEGLANIQATCFVCGPIPWTIDNHGSFGLNELRFHGFPNGSRSDNAMGLF